jgi:hypothetical protein
MNERQYHSWAGYVHAGDLLLEIAAIWEGVQTAEDAGISLSQTGRALSYNWSATVVALARGNVAVLRALIDEAAS